LCLYINNLTLLTGPIDARVDELNGILAELDNEFEKLEFERQQRLSLNVLERTAKE
jgi:hypothetical protein